MSEEVKNQTNVVNRKGSDVYYYRARVPADLQQHYGKAERWISLRTKEQHQANQKATIEQLKLDQEYAHLRAMQLAMPSQDISDDELERIALIWSAEALEEDEADRLDGLCLDDEFFEAVLLDTEFLATSMTEWLARGNHEHISALVDHELKRHGIKLDKDSQAYRRACNQFIKAGKRLSESLKLRNAGEIVETPAVDRTPIKPKSEDTLQYLLSYWKQQATPAIRSAEAASFAIEGLTTLTGNKPASKITKADVVSYKDKRIETVSPETVQKDLNLIKAIFNCAVRNAKLTANPAEGVIAPAIKGKKKARIPFSLEELKRIFTSNIYSQSYRPKGGAGEASFWLPLMALFTGARLTELGQLLIEDIQEEQGIRYFYITTDNSDDDDETTAKSLKTESSRRRVPIHPELLRCGLLEYVSTMQKAGHKRLFPAIKSASKQLTAPYSKWFNRMLREKLDITDKRKVFHSFRHTFKDACRISSILSEHHDRLTGHENKNIGDDYG
ncbi:MAG TPA: site-specific integrase, partial [Methylotenera sp.]|nr:site-specific integrase [Methylotenera sp.]